MSRNGTSAELLDLYSRVSPIQVSEKEPAYSVIIQKGEGYSEMYNNLTVSL